MIRPFGLEDAGSLATPRVELAARVWRLLRSGGLRGVASGSTPSPLSKVTLNDLRHSAITAWLNAGVFLKTAQAWSGHKTLSVLLDIYAGVMEGDDFVSMTRFEAALEDDIDEDQE